MSCSIRITSFLFYTNRKQQKEHISFPTKVFLCPTPLFVKFLAETTVYFFPILCHTSLFGGRSLRGVCFSGHSAIVFLIGIFQAKSGTQTYRLPREIPQEKDRMQDLFSLLFYRLEKKFCYHSCLIMRSLSNNFTQRNIIHKYCKPKMPSIG